MEDKRKIRDTIHFIELITLPLERLKPRLIFTGYHNYNELDGKSDYEIRRMVLDHVTVNQEEFFRVMASNNPEIKSGIKKALVMLGMSEYELYEKLGFNLERITKEDKNNKSINEKEQYLYETEKLFKMAYEEFLISDLSNEERVLTYINRVNKILNRFRRYALEEPGFVGSERYKDFILYVQSMPCVFPYKEDKTKNDYINTVMRKRHYDNMAKMLESFSIGSNTPKITLS